MFRVIYICVFRNKLIICDLFHIGFLSKNIPNTNIVPTGKEKPFFSCFTNATTIPCEKQAVILLSQF